MSFNVLNRKIHYWASFIAALPLLIMILTGLLLQMKKHSTWVQPFEHRGTATVPQIDFDDILAGLKTLPEMNVHSWDDVNRLDVRPDRGVVKAWLMNGYEVQVDLGTGQVLQTAYRRSDIIETLHDGSFFAGDWTKLGLFLPAGLVMLLLWAGGLWMWWVPFIAKRRRAALRRRMQIVAERASGRRRPVAKIRAATLGASHASPSASTAAGYPRRVTDGSTNDPASATVSHSRLTTSSRSQPPVRAAANPCSRRRHRVVVPRPLRRRLVHRRPSLRL
jgi:hypothetical protein